MIRKMGLGLAALAGLTVLVTGSSASAGGFNFGFYGGHDHYRSSPRSFYGGWGGGGHGYGGYSAPRRHLDWHDTSHFDYHPGGVVNHGNHYDYMPGHYDLHQDGHWDAH